jgi:heme O synthase-like polyprenyltransferase
MKIKESKPSLFQIIGQTSYTLLMVAATLYGFYQKKYIIAVLALIMSVGFITMTIRIYEKYINYKQSLSSK